MKTLISFLLLFPLAVLQTLAQGEKKDSLIAGFQRYQLQAPPEKIFLHLDKTTYLAGELAWFKVYDVDGYLNRPMGNSGIANVEILNKDQKPVLQARIALEQGKGDGSFLLPASLASGHYTIRAY